MSLEDMRTATTRGARWIVDHQGPDGFFPSRSRVVESCYKGLWALNTTGHTEEAAALATFISRWIAPNGDIPLPREEPAFFTTHYLYANTYLAIGAQTLGRFDLSQPLFRFIRSRQHPTLGGFISQGPETPEPHCLDTVSTSISGLTALYLGDLEVARRAAGFLQLVLDHQPQPSEFFYSTMDFSGRLITEWDAEQPHRRIDIQDPEQDWYFIGIATMFLPALFEATGADSYLLLARRYLDYLKQNCCPGAFTDLSSGKSGVGAAYLYRLTGEQGYREIALAVAEFIMNLQTPFGCWQESPQTDAGPPDSLSWSDMDMTAEYVLWLDQIRRHLH